VTRIEHLGELLDKQAITFSKLADASGIVIDTHAAHVMSLNESAAFLVDAVSSGARTDDELVSALVAEYEVDDDEARAHVETFLEELARHVGAVPRG